MLLNAEMIADKYQDEIYSAVSEPKGAEDFKKKHIDPAGDAVDSEYGCIIGAYMRGGFVVGFKAAIQLLMDCTGKGGLPQIYLPQKDEDNE